MVKRGRYGGVRGSVRRLIRGGWIIGQGHRRGAEMTGWAEGAPPPPLSRIDWVRGEVAMKLRAGNIFVSRWAECEELCGVCCRRVRRKRCVVWGWAWH
jgi:hypothetical protein